MTIKSEAVCSSIFLPTHVKTPSLITILRFVIATSVRSHLFAMYKMLSEELLTTASKFPVERADSLKILVAGKDISQE